MLTPIDGMTSDTGALDPMIGPKSGLLLGDGSVALDFEAGDVVWLGDVGAGGAVVSAAWARSGWGGASLPANDFATSTPPTRRRMTVTAAAMLPRRSPNFEELDIRRGCEPCER
ncbi:hypothetical protein GCM10009845_20220 [Pedococcus bigeumensis]